jgi:anti-sigma B factor antagonist
MTIGALGLGTAHDRPLLTNDDIVLASDIAARVAIAADTARYLAAQLDVRGALLPGGRTTRRLDALFRKSDRHTRCPCAGRAAPLGWRVRGPRTGGRVRIEIGPMDAWADIAVFMYTLEPTEGVGPMVVTLSGELDLASAPAFAPALADAASSGDVVVDLANLTFIDSSGLWALIKADAAAEAAGGTFTLRCPHGIVRRAMTYAGLDGLFKIEP